MRNLIKKVLVVGFGSIGKRHVRIIRDLYPSIKIMILRHAKCDPIDIEKFGIHDCVTNIGNALAFSPDAAIVATPATKHLHVAGLLARSGIPLLIEKPIASGTEGVQELISFCHDKEIVLMTAYNLRFLPSLVEFRNQLQLEKVGRVLSVHVTVGQYLPSWRVGIDYKKTVSAQKRLGGGVLLELSHEIDYISWIFGPIRWVKSHVSKQSSLDVDVEDMANVIFGFSESFEQQLVVTLKMDFFRHDSTRQCLVIGEEGSLKWDGITDDVMFFPEGGDTWEASFSSIIQRDYTYIEEIKHFFSLIELGGLPRLSGEDGFEALRVIEAIHASNNKGSIVYL